MAFYLPLEEPEIPAARPLPPPTFPSLLSDLPRELLLKALQGNYLLMGRLILDWDIDAQLLSLEGQGAVRRLSSEDLLRSQLLVRSIAQTPVSTAGRFLPQTYAAASILLTLVPPQEIVALPKGLRSQTQLYPCALTEQIPLDTDRTHAELLYRAQPDKAFISLCYTHPSTREALINQGIPTESIENLTTLEEIRKAILQIGQSVNRPKQAELLTLFMQAAFTHFYNRLMLSDRSKRVLFVHYYDQFYTPSNTSLSLELLKLLDVKIETLESSQLLTREMLLKYTPECLLISAPQPALIGKKVHQDPALHKIHTVAIVDDEIQQTPTHYAVLACYDLMEALR
jgi:iron complex transport system substrate-binding protein